MRLCRALVGRRPGARGEAETASWSRLAATLVAWNRDWSQTIRAASGSEDPDVEYEQDLLREGRALLGRVQSDGGEL